MITTADALDVMAIVAACHPRTAPRMDDEEAAVTTATVWAELFNAHKLSCDDLAEGVKLRAASQSDAPEPADIINAAKTVRRNRTESESREAREARQASLDAVKPEPDAVRAISVGFVPGPAPQTDRLEAARDALQDIPGGSMHSRTPAHAELCQAAIREYFAAKLEAKRGVRR